MACARSAAPPSTASRRQTEFYGILPPSISHEGYSAKPMHSYWDDFFALRGFQGRGLAGGDSRAPGRAPAGWRRSCEEFADRPGRLGGRGHGDRTASTTCPAAPIWAISIPPRRPSPCRRRDAGGHPAARVPWNSTFERYWGFFVERRAGEPWEAFTPYEIRNIGAFVRLGWRDRAQELLDFFLAYRRPPGWRHWAEVVFQDERAARFIGDMPHTWVGSDYIRSVLDMFVFERGSEGDATAGRTTELVLAAGIPAAWLDGPGVAIGDLPTPHGDLNYILYRSGRRGGHGDCRGSGDSRRRVDPGPALAAGGDQGRSERGHRSLRRR